MYRIWAYIKKKPRQRAQRYPCAAAGDVFVPAAGARSARDHGAGPTKTAGCKQDMSGARGGRLALQQA